MRLVFLKPSAYIYKNKRKSDDIFEVKHLKSFYLGVRVDDRLKYNVLISCLITVLYWFRWPVGIELFLVGMELPFARIELPVAVALIQ